MEENDRLRAACFAIGGKQCAQLTQQNVGRRHGIARGTGGTYGRALPATGADMRIDRNVIACWRNGAGGTKIEAAVTADNAGARVRADVRVEVDVARLIEAADE